MSLTPKLCKMNPDRKTSSLIFDKQYENMNGEYYLRGGTCWPIPIRIGADHGASGFILMAGRNVVTNKIFVFEQKLFLTVDHILDSTGGIEIEGLSHWFNTLWANYFASSFYYHQDESTHKTFLLQVLRSKMIMPKPSFVETAWQGDANMDALIWRLGNTGMLKFEKDSELHDALHLFEIQSNHKDTIPAIHALKCALVGLERYPWKVRHKNND